DSFPFKDIENDFWYIGQQVYSFLGKVGSNFLSYPDVDTPGLTTFPALTKAHFSDTILAEVGYLVSKIHTDSEFRHVYFSFTYLYGNDRDLKTQDINDTKEHQTVIVDRGNDLEAFFASLRLVFEHNRKHDKTLHNTKEKWEEAED